MNKRQLIIVGGPNGAGKTTFALEDLARRGGVYLGADAIAAELSPGNPAAAALEAGRLMVERLEELLLKDRRTVLESTVSGKSLAQFIRRAKEVGFHITVQYVLFDSAEDCVYRVQQRVLKGGHDVPADDVRRR